jgi:hypothetical protein
MADDDKEAPHAASSNSTDGFNKVAADIAASVAKSQQQPERDDMPAPLNDIEKGVIRDIDMRAKDAELVSQLGTGQVTDRLGDVLRILNDEKGFKAISAPGNNREKQKQQQADLVDALEKLPSDKRLYMLEIIEKNAKDHSKDSALVSNLTKDQLTEQLGSALKSLDDQEGSKAISGYNQGQAEAALVNALESEKFSGHRWITLEAIENDVKMAAAHLDRMSFKVRDKDDKGNYIVDFTDKETGHLATGAFHRDGAGHITDSEWKDYTDRGLKEVPKYILLQPDALIRAMDDFDAKAQSKPIGAAAAVPAKPPVVMKGSPSLDPTDAGPGPVGPAANQEPVIPGVPRAGATFAVADHPGDPTPGSSLPTLPGASRRV